MFKKYLLILLVLGILATLVLTGCAQSGASNAPPVDSISVVKNYYDAIAAKDFDKAMSFLADDVLMTSPVGKFQGKDASSRSLKEAMDAGFHSENSNYRESNGEVRYDYKVYFGSELVDQNTDGLTIVKDGKIVFDGLEKDKPK